MHITLYVKGNTVELYVETAPTKGNPSWAVDWVAKNMNENKSSEEAIFFSCIQGCCMVIDTKKILSFLDTLIEHGNNNEISIRSGSFLDDSITIRTVEQAADVYKLIQNSLDSVDFKGSHEQVKTKPSETVSAKEQFLKAYHKYCSQNQNFFGQHGSKSSYEQSELSEIVEAAKDPRSLCRAVFKDLGWMKHDGSLTNTVPEDIVKAYDNTIGPDEGPASY